MLKIFILGILIIAEQHRNSSIRIPQDDARFRWDVKTLTDDSNVDWQESLDRTRLGRFATIEGLTTKATQYSSCHSVGKNSRRADEKRIVKLRVRLIKVKKEDNDNDYHIVLQSLINKNHFMVAEIPDPEDKDFQTQQFSWMKNVFSSLRQKIEQLMPNGRVTGSFKNFPAGTEMTVYGVPFWDCKHPGNVSGAAKDFREIHPVLELDQ
jgi:hypothetical protein